jgi:hypothetical protein
MQNSSLTPEESLLIISQTINETKERFKAHGGMLIFWGILVVLVFSIQYLLWYLELNEYMIHTSYLFIVGAIYTGVHIHRKKIKHNTPKTILNNILNITWVIGVNLMIMGLFFSKKLGEAGAPIFVILFAFMIIVVGLAIRFKPLIIGGAITNLIGLGTFMVNSDYHGLSLMLAAMVGMIIPGILLNSERKIENV